VNQCHVTNSSATGPPGTVGDGLAVGLLHGLNMPESRGTIDIAAKRRDSAAARLDSDVDLASATVGLWSTERRFYLCRTANCR
jgi:hypothetical protein